MRIPYPTRISPLHSAVFAVLLCLVQAIEGTPIYFSAATFVFIVIATFAFNAAGGLSRPSGGYVFFYALLTVILSLVFKAIFGEAADTNLFAPKQTMLVYVGSIAAMYVAVVAARRVTPKRALLDGITQPESWGAASLGCIIVGVAMNLFFILSTAEGEDVAQSRIGSFTGFISHLDHFLPLGILLGTMYTVRKSGGRRLLSLPVAFAVLYMLTADGLFGGSKEGFFTPLLCVLLAAAVSKYNFSLPQIAAGGLALIFSIVYVVPFVQLNKYVAPNLSDKINFTAEYISDIATGSEEQNLSKEMQY